MYQTMWLDISSGLENEIFDIVLRKMARFKRVHGFGHVEAGIVFEEFDVFAIFEMDDSDALLDFILTEIAPIEGVEEIRMGRLSKVSAPLTTMGNRPLTVEDLESAENPMYAKGAGQSFFLIYMDALPLQYPRIMEALDGLEDPNMRYYAYCLDSYEEDMVVCLNMEGLEEAKYHIVSTLRKIEGLRDTRTFVVNNVRFL